MALTRRRVGVNRAADYGVRTYYDTGSPNDGDAQAVVLLDSNGNTISLSSTLVTFAHTRPALADSTNTEIIASNSSRKAGSYIMNNSGTTLWGNYGSTAAAANQGFKITSGQIFIFNTTQAIRLFQNSGSPVNVDIFEAT